MFLPVTRLGCDNTLRYAIMQFTVRYFFQFGCLQCVCFLSQGDLIFLKRLSIKGFEIRDKVRIYMKQVGYNTIIVLCANVSACVRV